MTVCVSPSDPNALWAYCPSLAAAILFSILYGLTTSTHILQAYLYKRRFLWVLIMGALWETLAFIFRCLSVQNPLEQGYYDPQFLLILLAPLWINAFDYMLLGRMVYYFLPDRMIFGIKATRLGKMFVWLDISTFVVQLAGGFMTVGQDSTTTDTPQIVTIGLHVYTAGIALQAAIIICFLSLVISFQRRIRKEISPERAREAGWLLLVLYASLGLIPFRIIFRMIEFSAGADSPITNNIETHEWYPYVFDSVPMFISLVLFNLKHPGSVLVGPEGDFPRLSRKEKKALKEEKKRQKRERKEEKKREKRERKEAKRGIKREGMELV